MDAEEAPVDRLWERGRDSMRDRLARVSAKRWQIAQCAIAAGVSWLIAADLLGHTTPFFAPVAAVVSLGTSYGQRLRRGARGAGGGALGGVLARPLGVPVGPRRGGLVVGGAPSVNIPPFFSRGPEVFT